LYNILIEFGVPMKLVRLIKMCLNETYTKVHIWKHLYDNFPIKNGLKHGEMLHCHCFSILLTLCHKEGPGIPGGNEII
jgi:hypothetical protein